MVAWPQEDPLYLAVFRRPGTNGALTLRSAAKMLQKWSSSYPADYGQVKVRLLTLTPRSSWEVVDECNSHERQEAGGAGLRFSSCGWFKILSTARGSRSERFVRGVLQTMPDGEKVILKTDPETYADAVLAAEAQDLRGEAAKALRAVIVWDGVHGSHRHPDSPSLCDTTHCMVFRGSTSTRNGRQHTTTDPILLRLLDRLAVEKRLDWFPFSEGGVEQWQRQVPVAELQQLVNESTILDLRRVRMKNGETAVHLIYSESDEQVSCEFFRAKLKLPSCPETIEYDAGATAWNFHGIGKGHGLGLSVDKARRLGRSGNNAAAIIKDAYASKHPPE
jgi:peptidoglycan hydrolase-like amidase